MSIAAFTARMARVTGHPMRVVQSGGNFHVFVVNEDDRRLLGPRLKEIIPGIDQSALDTVIDMPRSTYCLVFAWDPNDDGAYEKAVAIIRSEHPDLLRLSCIHEEMAQGMGLANDSPEARPSVFNDDEEYALLTTLDEKMLTHPLRSAAQGRDGRGGGDADRAGDRGRAGARRRHVKRVHHGWRGGTRTLTFETLAICGKGRRT